MSDSPIRTDSSGTPVPASLTGYFLVSETELMDPNFHRTVVLIIDHNDDGAFGLVLNRPADASLGDLLEEFNGYDAGRATLFVGGPVEQHYLFTIHSGLPQEHTSPHASVPVPGVVFEPVFTAMEEYLRDEWKHTEDHSGPAFNFYLGYAGWGPGQLEGELDEDAWLITPADARIVFNDRPADGWSAALEKKGGLYSIIAQTGFRPSLN